MKRSSDRISMCDQGSQRLKRKRSARCVLSAVGFLWLVLVSGCEPPVESNQDELSETKIEPNGAPIARNNARGSDDSEGGKLSVGDKAPDFEVELLGGKSQRFSKLIAKTKGPTVLLFNRAHW